jgi:hypothetical protein
MSDFTAMSPFSEGATSGIYHAREHKSLNKIPEIQSDVWANVQPFGTGQQQSQEIWQDMPRWISYE